MDVRFPFHFSLNRLPHIFFLGIDYDNLNYGTSLGFAAVASNNGHDSDTGEYFANNTEILADFTSRAVHTETVVGKQFVNTYYGQEQNSSYYVGCSTGGRQGFYAALHYPDDFDGILAGSPATNFNHLISWTAMLGRFIGAPGNTSASFISSDLWNVTSTEIFSQCDGLDGVVDGIITEPDDCLFRPEQLLCSSSSNSTDSCLTSEQVEALRLIYAPLYGDNNTLLYSRFEPGAEAGGAWDQVFNGDEFHIAYVRLLPLLIMYGQQIDGSFGRIGCATSLRTMSITTIVNFGSTISMRWMLSIPETYLLLMGTSLPSVNAAVN